MRQHTVREARSSNANPIRITDEFAVQTSKQYTATLLCKDCEQRLRKYGEDWVLAHCWRGETFALASLVFSAKPKFSSPEASLYYAAEIDGINASAMTYFAASMFWRAAVHNWSNRSSEPAINLGPYREQLRQYLVGAAEFPKNCMLSVVLPPANGRMVRYMMHPFPKRTRGCTVYTLLFLGIQFSIFVGRQIQQNWREMDFARGPGNPIGISARFDEMFARDLVLLFGRHKRALAMLDEIEDRCDPDARNLKLAELLPRMIPITRANRKR